MYYLENENLKITIDAKGAELKSVFNKLNETELLWQANTEFWGKSSPVLFPIVGTLKNGFYVYNNIEYQLTRHGFARDYNFKLEEATNFKLVFCLESSVETLNIYPFLFRLKIIYTLTVNSLQVTYKVENISVNKIMYFSLGAHPAFNVGKSVGDFCKHKLQFNKDNYLLYSCLDKGLLTTVQKSINLNKKQLLLDYKLFENDALVMLDMKSDKISLLDKDDNNILCFEFENFPYFGLWTVKNAGFICLEPWAGISDFETHNNKFENKEGINMLKPNEVWSASWTLAIL